MCTVLILPVCSWGKGIKQEDNYASRATALVSLMRM
jgi:hypothetical protein